MKTQSNLQEIVDMTLVSIRKDFLIHGLYKLQRTKDMFCIHVNGLVNVGLAELGDAEISKNIDSVLASNLFSGDTNLFYREINSNNEITIPTVNACKNAIAILSLIADGRIELANKVIDALYKSKLFNKLDGLFYREIDSTTGNLNPLILSQTNFWIVIALCRLNKIEKAKQLMNSIERNLFDNNAEMFFSQDCEREPEENESCIIQNKFKTFFSDDQGLAAIAYHFLNQEEKAKSVLKNTLRSSLYDQKICLFNRNISEGDINFSKNTYKNSLLCIALHLSGFKREAEKIRHSIIDILFDKGENLFKFSDTDSTKIPDNSMLAVLALSSENIRHIIF